MLMRDLTCLHEVVLGMRFGELKRAMWLGRALHYLARKNPLKVTKFNWWATTGLIFFCEHSLARHAATRLSEQQL